jgi:hypothetical protein
MIHSASLAYQTFQVYDSRRSAQSIFFNSEFRSNMSVSEKNWAELGSSSFTFKVGISDMEIGTGEFALSTMIMDGVKNRTYEVDIK